MGLILLILQQKEIQILICSVFKDPQLSVEKEAHIPKGGHVAAYRMIQDGRSGLRRHSQKVQLDQVTQDHVQLNFEHIQRWKVYIFLDAGSNT